MSKHAVLDADALELLKDNENKALVEIFEEHY
jgi:hypothetical protein